ncbi:MAG TPA: response regulator, partial [Saprospiraceae bacterium]|nr:response regulator [Saprospiraceae bacterium]
MDSSLLHVILADDDESDRTNFTEALEESRIKTEVYAVKDGVELMEFLTREDTPVPHILFLDLNMPMKNGLTCLKEIRSIEKLKDVAVAIYSTSSYEKDIEETFHYGANVYIKKPTDFDTLKKVLHKVLSAAYVYREPPFSIE